MGAMELRHLRTIAAVARHGSFSRAAEELHLAQSAVSQQIRRLEQELGVEVFRRSSRSVELTPEGEVILGYEYAATLIWEEEFVVAVPTNHPLTRGGHVTFEQLAGEDLIAYRENSALRRRLERTMADRGLAPRNAFICTEMAAVRALVSK